MNFRLEPHHLPSDSTASLDAPADAVFSLLWKGRERQIMLRWVRWKPSVFLLFVSINGEIGVVTQCPNSHLEAPMTWKQPQHSPRKLLSLARTMESKSNLGISHSFFRATDGEPQMVMRQKRGKGIWLGADLEIVGEFDLSLLPDTAEDVWKAAFFAAFKDESSEMRFAWQWARMTEEKRRAWFYDGPDGYWELERLLRLVLQSADELWGQHTLLSWTRGFTYIEGWFVDERNLLVDAKREAPRVERWRRFINISLCQPQWKAVEFHLLIRQWISNEHRTWGINVQIPRPTAHERLEARLELRDWLEQNVSPQRRRWLLPP